MEYIPFVASNRVNQRNGSVERNGLHRITGKIFCHRYHPLETAVAATAASVCGAAAIRVLHNVSRTRDRGEILLKSGGLSLVVRQNRSRLSVLRGRKICRSKLTLQIGNLVVLRIQFKLTELVQNGLDTLRNGSTVIASFCSNGVLEVGGSRFLITAALCKLSLETEGCLHVSNLVAEELLCNGILRSVDRSVDSGKTAAECSLNIAKARSNSGLDTAHLTSKHLVTETTADLIGLVHPRIQVIAESTTESVAPTIAAKEDKQKQNPSPVSTETETAAVAVTATVHRCYGHYHVVCRFIHCLIYPS